MTHTDTLDIQNGIRAILGAEAWPADAFPVTFVFRAKEAPGSPIWFSSLECAGSLECLNGLSLMISSDGDWDERIRIGRRLANCSRRAASIGMTCIRARMEEPLETAHQTLKAEAEASRWDDPAR